MREKIWSYRNQQYAPEQAEAVAQEYHIPKVIATLLLNRGISSENDIKSYLTKSMRGVHHPYGLEDMETAAKRIKQAVDKQEKIIVYGDYDVDGITSTSLVYMFLKQVGADVQYYIPDRAGEGYGINIMALNKFIKQGIQLVITVDCGITAIGEVEFAALQGLDIIITDHHTCKEDIPNALAVINPKRPDSEYPFDGLAGVGVAFKLVMAAAMEFDMRAAQVFDDYVEIAAIGTVADVVPLLDENRIIVDKGLKALANSKYPGIRALLEVAGAAGKPVTASTIAFMLAPRLNAAGRLGQAGTAVELILTEDETEAYKLARELDDENRKRQMTEQGIFNEALEMLQKDPDFAQKHVIVLAKEGWHQGVIGIVASKLNEMFYKPCILISCENGVGKGSGRSIPAFNLFDALSYCEDVLTNFGGHAAAAGLGINQADVAEFEQKINAYAKKTMQEEDFVPRISIDCPIQAEQVCISNVNLLAKLEPFGMNNPKPVFSIPGLRIADISQMGMDNKHIRLKLSNGNRCIMAVGFGMGDYAGYFKAGDIVDTAFSMDINSYQGTDNVQLVLKDIRMSR